MENSNWFKKLLILIISALFFSVTSFTYAANMMDKNQASKSHQTRMKQMPGCVKKAWELKRDMRKLWEDHITYTRNYIISALADLGDKDAIADRLLKNQDDIGDAISPFYGSDNGKKLANLLRDHIVIATLVVNAAKIGNTQELSKAQEKWRNNAGEIASFLSSANPNWSKNNLATMLYKHLDFTTGEVVSRLNKNWNDDINFYDKGHAHMLMFSDILAHGIIQQFPEKFL